MGMLPEHKPESDKGVQYEQNDPVLSWVGVVVTGCMLVRRLPDMCNQDGSGSIYRGYSCG